MTFLLITSICILFLSCSKDDDPSVSESDLIVGVWKLADVIIFDEKSKAIVSSYGPEPCSGENTFIFEAEGRSALETYQKKGNDCERTKTRAGDYTFDESTKEITIHYDSGQEETFTVYKVSETEMWFNLGPIKTENEGDLFYHILNLKKR